MNNRKHRHTFKLIMYYMSTKYKTLNEIALFTLQTLSALHLANSLTDVKQWLYVAPGYK